MFKTSLLAVLAVATLSPAIQVPFTPLSVPPQSPPIPHHQFAAFLEEIRANGSIPGISVGVVRLGNTSGYLSQFVSSGFKTEGATKEDMTADVRLFYVLYTRRHNWASADPVCARVMLQSLCCDGHGSSHR